MIPEHALRGIPLLEGLTAEAQAVLAARGIEHRYAAGETLFRAGDEARGLIVVADGKVRVSRQVAGRGQVVHVEGPGGTLGEVPLFTGASYPATAIAMEPTLAFTRLDRLAFASVRARLAAWIAERARQSAGPVVSLGLTHTALAEELGTVREVVVKELAALRRLGAIAPRSGGRLEVRDPALLETLISADGPSHPRGPARGGAGRGGRRRSAGR